MKCNTDLFLHIIQDAGHTREGKLVNGLFVCVNANFGVNEFVRMCFEWFAT